MSVRVESRGSSSVEPMVVGERPPPEPKAAPKAGKASGEVGDLVEQFRATENDAWASFVGRRLEQWFQGAMASVPEGGKREMEVSLEGGEEVIGSGRGKFTVEHKDGQYLVTMQAAAAVKVGLMGPKSEATASAGGEGTVTFRFGSGKEAADAMAAMVQVEPQLGLEAVHLKGVAHRVLDADAQERTLRALNRLQTVELGVQVGLQATLGNKEDELRAGASITGGTSVRLDLAKRELVFAAKVDAGVSADFSRKLLSGVLTEKSQVGQVKGTAILEGHYPISMQDLERIEQGGAAALKDVALESASRSRPEAVVKVEGNVAGLEFKAERRGDPVEMLEAIKSGDGPLRWQDWSFQGFKVNGGLSADVDLGAVKLKASIKDRQTVINAKGELAPLVQQGTSRVQAAERQEREITAFRARAN